jgi:hypothetical protein
MSRRDTISIVIENRDDHRRWTPLTSGAMDTRIRREVERTIEEQDRTGEFTYVGIAYNGMTHRLYTVDEIEEGQRLRAAQEQTEREQMEADRTLYSVLRQTGEVYLGDSFSREDRARALSRLRMWGRRDGYKVTASTVRDYMKRPSTTVNLTDGHGNIVRPDAPAPEAVTANAQIGYRVDRRHGVVEDKWVTVAYVDITEHSSEEAALAEARTRLARYTGEEPSATYRLVRHTLTETIEEIA